MSGSKARPTAGSLRLFPRRLYLVEDGPGIGVAQVQLLNGPPDFFRLGELAALGQFGGPLERFADRLPALARAGVLVDGRHSLLGAQHPVALRLDRAEGLDEVVPHLARP